jgi:biotin operon repressor
MKKRDVPVTQIRDGILNIMMGFAGKDNFVTIPLTFARFCDGDLIIAALFSQVLYWTGVTDDPNGWVAKSYEDWSAEISLTRSQIDRAVKALEKVGLETKKERSKYHDYAPTIHYRFNREVLSKAATAFFEDPVNNRQEMRGKRVSNLPKVKQKLLLNSNESDLLNLSKSHSMNSNESEALDFNKSLLETGRDLVETEERETTFAPVGAGADIPLQGDPRALLEDANEMLPLEGKNSTRKENSTRKPTKTTATTPIPPTPLSAAPRKQSALQAENAALVDALGEAWGIKATPADYSLYIKKAQKLVSSIPVEKFKAFCDRQKAKAGDYADKLTIATITENGRISEFVQWEQNERVKAEKRARDEEKFFQAYPDQRPGYVPEGGYASPEKVEALRNLLRSRGQYSD